MLARINDIDIFYTTRGKGRPLMLMHGGMGFDHTYFLPWLDPLTDKLELICYDHRGNGRSTPLSNFDGIDHTTWAADADALRRHLGHEQIILLGHSCGGFAAIEYALRYGKHLAGLVLCCTTPAMDYPEVVMANAQSRGTPEQLSVLGKLFTGTLTSNEEFRSSLNIVHPLYFKRFHPKIGSQILNNMNLNFHALNYSAASWFPSVNFLPKLRDIVVPTLIIGGKEDWIMPPAQGADRLHAAIPNSELVIFENSGHLPFVEEQERFLKTISDWGSI